MSNKNDVERRCLYCANNKLNPKNAFWKKIKYAMQACKKSERPDFYFMDNNIVVGIEHFLCDVLQLNSQSETRLREKKNERAIEYYKNNSFALDNDIKTGVAKKFIEDVFLEIFKCVRDFSYQQFEKHYVEVVSQHNVSAYRNHLVELSGRPETLVGALIEIPYYEWRSCGYIVTNKGNTYLKRINGIPITRNMITALLDGGWSFAILCMVPLFVGKNSKKTTYVIPIDLRDCSSVKDVASINSIVLYDAFDFPYKPTEDSSVQINLEID